MKHQTTLHGQALNSTNERSVSRIENTTPGLAQDVQQHAHEGSRMISKRQYRSQAVRTRLSGSVPLFDIEEIRTDTWCSEQTGNSHKRKKRCSIHKLFGLRQSRMFTSTSSTHASLLDSVHETWKTSGHVVSNIRKELTKQ